MTKRQIIDEIMSVNRTADPAFLAEFDDGELGEYLEHLQVIGTPRLSGDARRYEGYFANCPMIGSSASGAAPRVLERTSERIAAPDRENISAGVKEPAGRPRQKQLAAAVVSETNQQDSQSPFAGTDDQKESWLF